MSSFGPLDNERIVFRAVLRKQHHDKVSGKILRDTFLRRPPKPDGTPNDQNGLSVNLNCEVEDIFSYFRTVYAIGKLVVGDIRTIPTTPSLDVIRNLVNHANITGLPEYGENVELAERLATLLSNICESVYPPA